MIPILMVWKQEAWEGFIIFHEYRLNCSRIASSNQNLNVKQTIVLGMKKSDSSKTAFPYFRLQIGQINEPPVLSDYWPDVS